MIVSLSPHVLWPPGFHSFLQSDLSFLRGVFLTRRVSHVSVVGADISAPCRYPKEADGGGGAGTEFLEWPLGGTEELIVVRARDKFIQSQIRL